MAGSVLAYLWTVKMVDFIRIYAIYACSPYEISASSYQKYII